MTTNPNKPIPTFEKRSSSGIVSPLIVVLFAIAILITAVVAAVFSHKYGYQRGFKASQTSINKTIESENITATDLQSLNLKVELLENELSTAKQERDISLNNLELMRENMQALEVSNLQAQQVNDIYASQLAQQGGLPLQVIAARIEPLPENAFEYRFDVALLAADNEAHRLTPKLTLLNESSLVNVPLDPKSYRTKGISRIRGRFVMPEGFTPKQVKITLAANGETVEQIYNWRLSKPIADMPISLSQAPELDDRPIVDE